MPRNNSFYRENHRLQRANRKAQDEEIRAILERRKRDYLMRLACRQDAAIYTIYRKTVYRVIGQLGPRLYAVRALPLRDPLELDGRCRTRIIESDQCGPLMDGQGLENYAAH